MLEGSLAMAESMMLGLRLVREGLSWSAFEHEPPRPKLLQKYVVVPSWMTVRMKSPDPGRVSFIWEASFGGLLATTAVPFCFWPCMSSSTSYVAW